MSANVIAFKQDFHERINSEALFAFAWNPFCSGPILSNKDDSLFLFCIHPMHWLKQIFYAFLVSENF